MTSNPVTPIQQCLDRLRAGDPEARDDLLRVSRKRLLAMARKMLDGYPSVRRWEGAEDVLQNTLVRLDRGLSQLSLESTSDFLRLAAAQIRWELIDLYRHYFGPHGPGANHATPKGSQPSGFPNLMASPEGSDDPARLVNWSELHERIATLPDEERDVFDLLWYHGLSQTETARLLNVSVRTVKRRWQSARLLLAAILDGEPIK